MQYKRADRVSAQLKEELGRILLKEVKDPNLTFVTITRVKITNDLKYAKIHYSVLGDKTKRVKATQALQRALPFIRREVGHNLGLRIVPELSFYFDDSSEYAEHIQSLLDKINNKNDAKLE